MSTVAEWVADPACAGNAMTLLVAGLIYANEGNYVEALKACHTGLNLEMCGPWRPTHAKCLELRPCLTSALVQKCVAEHRDVSLTPCVFAGCRMALSVQVYLQIDRPDQAEKQLKVLTQTCLCSVALPVVTDRHFPRGRGHASHSACCASACGCSSIRTAADQSWENLKRVTQGVICSRSSQKPLKSKYQHT